ncbi:DNA-directed RNA polymerase [Candidatus Micrarchaeota archaeon]|nr:MAG: DNA-directed RNA polymerase [Candidatus Micrarchaeota archaeon]
MYQIVTIKDTIRIPPKLFSDSLEKSALEALKQQYEGKIDKDLGVVISVMNPREISDGIIIPGDEAAYHHLVFDALVFTPEMHEVIRGKVIDITEFGAFVRFGPIEGLTHISQITDDFMSYNEKNAVLAGKESRRVLKKEDVVTARIIAISLKNTVADSKINLTMRQKGLGKEEWLEEKKKGKKAGK